METLNIEFKNTLAAWLRNKNDIVIALDQDGNIIACNKIMEKVFRKNKSEIIGSSIYNFFSFLKSHLQRCLEEVFEGNWGILKPKDWGLSEMKEFIFDLEYFPVYSKSGHIFALFLITNFEKKEKYTDRSEKETSEISNWLLESSFPKTSSLESQHLILEEIGRELLAADSRTREYIFLEDLIRKIADYSNLFVYLINWKEKKFIYKNRRISEALGYDNNEIKAPHLFQRYLIHPEDWLEIEKSLSDFKNSNGSIELEYRIKAKDGSWKWFLTRLRVYQTVNEEISEVLGTSIDITQSKEMEIAIKRNELILKESQKIAKMGHWEWIIGKDGKEWTRLSDNLYEIYGFKDQRPAINFKEFIELVFPEDRHIVIDAVNEIFETMKPFDIRHRIKRQEDGKTTYIYCKGRVLEAQEGKVTRLIGISLDITELELAKEELRKINAELEDRIRERTNELKNQKEYLQNVLTNIPAAVAVVKGDNHIYQFTNGLHYDYTGRQDLIGKTVAEVFPDADSQGITRMFDQVYHLGKSFYVEEFATSAYDQGIFKKKQFCNIALIPLKDIDEKVTGVLIHAIDVSNLVQTRRKISESEKKLKQLLEAIPQMAWTALINGEVNYYNQRWYEYTGQSIEESYVLGWEEVIHPNDLQSSVDLWMKSLKEGIPFTKENRFRGVNNDYRWFLVMAVPIVNSENKIILWVGTCTDIHDQKIYQEELLMSNKELKKINMDMDNFIYTASHDLKLPISNIEGIIEGLSFSLKEKQIADSDIDQMVDYIRQSVNRFHKTIKDLTEISKVQKNLNPDVGDINVLHVIEDVKRDLHELISNSNPVISVKIEECSEIRFSRRNFRSIVYNLLSNALKFKSNERTLHIDISVYKEEQWCVVRIEDNGLGIKEESKDKIFEMFRRLHDHVEGTGIGLYIVKRIVDNAEGKIEVESKEGEGSVFKVYFKT